MNQRFKVLRRRLNVTQSEFAERVGVSLAYVKKIEGGARPLSGKLIRATRYAFNVSEEWLRNGGGSFLNDAPAPPPSALTPIKTTLSLALFESLRKEEQTLINKELRRRLNVELKRRFRSCLEAKTAGK